MAPLTINPPLLNSANPWCTTLSQLQDLYTNPHTGAITTRTSLLSPSGFPHNSAIHQFTFYNPTTLSASTPNKDAAGDASTTASLNTLGYSPHPLSTYLSYIQTLSDTLCSGAPLHGRKAHKPVIVSVTGTAEEVVGCYAQITQCQRSVRMPLAMEVNLSCPNIPGKPPPAYSRVELGEYLVRLKAEVRRLLLLQRQEKEEERGGGVDVGVVPIGIKTPPYTYHDQFQSLIDALLDSSSSGSSGSSSSDTPPPVHADDTTCPISFITAVNTLGSSLLLSPTVDIHHHQGSQHDSSSTNDTRSFQPTLNSASGSGIGGLAGAPLHPLALGNVYTIKQMLASHASVLAGIQVIGVGGVADAEGYKRMREVGASAVGVGTALGRRGIAVFEEIATGL